jgi:hypothetical protein
VVPHARTREGSRRHHARQQRRLQPQLRLRLLVLLVGSRLPEEAALGVRPHCLEYRERRPPVERDRAPEELPVPAEVR